MEDVDEERRQPPTHHIHEPLRNSNKVAVYRRQNRCEIIKDPLPVMQISRWRNMGGKSCQPISSRAEHGYPWFFMTPPFFLEKLIQHLSAKSKVARFIESEGLSSIFQYNQCGGSEKQLSNVVG